MVRKSILGNQKVYLEENIIKKEDYTLKVKYFGVCKDSTGHPIHPDYPTGSIELIGPDIKISFGSRKDPVSLTGLPFLVAVEKTVTTSTLEAAIIDKYNVRPDINFLRELLREGLRPYMKLRSPESFW